MTPTSPCINVCRMHESTGWCEGCARTLEEIATWSQMDEAGQRRVWELLPARQARLRSLQVVAVPGSRG